MDAGVPMISVISSASCAIFPDGSIVLDPSTPEEEVRCQLSKLTTR